MCFIKRFNNRKIQAKCLSYTCHKRPVTERYCKDALCDAVIVKVPYVMLLL